MEAITVEPAATEDELTEFNLDNEEILAIKNIQLRKVNLEMEQELLVKSITSRRGLVLTDGDWAVDVNNGRMFKVEQ